MAFRRLHGDSFVVVGFFEGAIPSNVQEFTPASALRDHSRWTWADPLTWRGSKLDPPHARRVSSPLCYLSCASGVILIQLDQWFHARVRGPGTAQVL